MKSNPSSIRAFTLVEILVSVSILSVIMIMAAQMLNISSATWKKGNARADNFTQARVILSTIERDIQAMVLRRDLAAFVDANGDPACAFYTRFPAPGGDRKLSLIQYKFDATPTEPKLLRLDSPFDYSGQATLTLNETEKLPNLDPAANPALGSQNISEGIIAFQIQFLNANGNLTDHFSFNYQNPQDSTNTQATVISLIVLDSDAYQFAKKLGHLAPLLQSLGGTPATNQSYAQLWTSVISSPIFGSSLPAPIRAGLNVFEKRITLPAAVVK